MKKNRFALTVVITLLFPCLSYGAGIRDYYVRQSPGEVTVDGELTEWRELSSVVLDCPKQVYMTTTIYWEGKDDLSARVYFMRDRDNLYMAVDVTDDIFWQTGAGEGVWGGDSIQMAFDALNDKTIGAYGDDDYEYGFALTPLGPEVWCWKAASGQSVGRIEGIQLAVKRVDGHTIYEAAIPWKYLAPFNIQKDFIMGFNLIINDNDKVGRESWIGWSRGIGETKDPSLYNDLIFEPEIAENNPGKMSGKLYVDKVYFSHEKKIPARGFVFNRLREMKQAKIILALKDRDGNILRKSQEVTDLRKGLNRFEMPYCIDGVLDGEYKLELIVEENKDVQVSVITSAVKIISLQRVKEKMDEVGEKARLLEELIQKAKGENIDTSYQDAVVALTQYTLSPRLMQSDVGSAEKLRWTRASQNIEYLSELVQRTISELENIRKNPSLQVKVPRYDVMSDIEIRDGFFFKDGRPIVLIGPVGWCEIDQERDIIVRMGANVVHRERGPWWGTCGPDEFKGDMSFLLRPFEKRELAVDHLLPIHHFSPKWAMEKWPDLCLKKQGGRGGWITYCLDNPRSKEFLEEYLRRIIPDISQEPNLLAYILANEAAYVCRCKYSAQMFREWLKGRHQDIERLNQIWNENYADFEEIQPSPDGDANWPRGYDWRTFNQERFTNFFGWMQEIIREMDKTTPTHVKVMYDKWIWLTLYEKGIDREALARLTEINGCNGTRFYEDDRYAFGFLHASFTYDLLKSMAPDKPIIDSEWHTKIPMGKRFEGDFNERVTKFMRASLWLTYLHGVNSINYWVWLSSEEPPYGVINSFQHQAASLNAVSRTALDVRRLADHILAFQQEKPQMALLYSMPSILNSRHLEYLHEVYEGLYFQDTKTGFITERQVAEGMLEKYPLLVVAGARRVKDETYKGIEEYVRRGGKLVIIGDDSLRYDEYDRKRDITKLLKSANVMRLPVSSARKYWESFDEILDEAKVEREIRVVDTQGEKVMGVGARTANLGDKRIVFVINLNQGPAQVMLQSPKKIEGIKDVITGEVKQNLLNLKPMDMVLGVVQYD